MPIEAGKKAPAFTLPDQGGDKVSLEDFAGKTASAVDSLRLNQAVVSPARSAIETLDITRV